MNFKKMNDTKQPEAFPVTDSDDFEQLPNSEKLLNQPEDESAQARYAFEVIKRHFSDSNNNYKFSTV